MQLGQNLLKYRKECGLTQKDIAEALGISFQTVSKWERDMCFPDISVIPKLADILGVNTDTLLGHIPGEVRKTVYHAMYENEAYYFGTAPTPFCYRILDKYPPARHLKLLEIGCGEGRDAVFFARNGYDVTAFDIVPDGIKKAEQLAAFHNVTINAFVTDMITFSPKEQYDIVYGSRVLHYLPKENRDAFFETYKNATVSGGINAFLVLVDKPFVGSAPDNDETSFLMKSGEIFTCYHDWEFLVFEEDYIDCNSSGVPHKHCVNLMIARKP